MWICFLMIQPALAGICLASQKQNTCENSFSGNKSACGNTKNQSPCDNKNNNCADNSCNCCVCCGCFCNATLEKSSVRFLENSTQNKFNIEGNKNFVSSFLSECWHPPKMI